MNKGDVVRILEDLLKSLKPEEKVSITTLGDENYIISGADNIDTTEISWFVPAKIQIIKIDGKEPVELNGGDGDHKIPIIKIGSITKLAV